MSAYAAPIEVCQAALHRCGEDTIADMDEGSAASLVAQSNYEGLVRANLTRHAWLFATETVTLTSPVAVVVGDYTWAWAWTPEILNVRWVMLNGRRLRRHEYSIQGQRILTQDPYIGGVLQVVATARVNEGVWADDFMEAMVVRLQGLFLESLADKWQDGAVKIKTAELLFRQAIVRDKRQQPATTAEFATLAEAWRTRGRRSHYLG